MIFEERDNYIIVTSGLTVLTLEKVKGGVVVSIKYLGEGDGSMGICIEPYDALKIAEWIRRAILPRHVLEEGEESD